MLKIQTLKQLTIPSELWCHLHFRENIVYILIYMVMLHTSCRSFYLEERLSTQRTRGLVAGCEPFVQTG